MWCSVLVSRILSFFRTLNLSMFLSLITCWVIALNFRFLRLSVVPEGGSLVMEIFEADGVSEVVSSNLSLSSWELIVDIVMLFRFTKADSALLEDPLMGYWTKRYLLCCLPKLCQMDMLFIPLKVGSQRDTVLSSINQRIKGGRKIIL